MKVSVNSDGGLTLKEVFSGLALETAEGNMLAVCMRDDTLEMQVVGTGRWFRVNMETGQIYEMARCHEEEPKFPGVDIDAVHKPAPIAEFKEGEFYVRICLTNGYSYLRLRADTAGWCQVDRPTIDLVHNAEQAATLNQQLRVQSPVKWSDLPQSERDACMIRVRDRDERNQSNGEDKQPKPTGMMVDLDSHSF